jgi:hypothetical protein
MTDKADSPHLLAYEIKAHYYSHAGCYNEALVKRAWNELVTLFKRVAV